MGHYKEDRWRTALHSKFHTFAGNYHKLATTDPYRFAAYEGTIIMRMAPPQTTKEASIFIYLCIAKSTRNAPSLLTKSCCCSFNIRQPSFFDAEEYSKHLVGLSYSVPVVELLLAPLKKPFAQRSYVGYCYRYPWEAARGGGGKEDARSCLRPKASVSTSNIQVEDRKRPAEEASTNGAQDSLPPAMSGDVCH
jgi:hypothetical protein